MRHFGRVLAFGGVVAVVLALAGPSEVVAQKKKNIPVADNGYGATDADYKAIQNRKELTGTIVASSGTVVTLRSDNPHMEPNPKYRPPKQGAANYNNLANQLFRTSNDLMVQQQRLSTTTNPKTYQQALQKYNQDLMRYQQQSAQYYNQMMAQYYKATANMPPGSNPNDPNYSGPPTADTATPNDPFIVVHAYKEYDLETTEKIVVRKMFLPFEYDDEGKPKTYTEKEKKDLRGDDKTKPGYQSKMEEIAKGMEARLHLIPPPPKKKDADKEKDKDAKADDEPVARPTIRMVVLTKDAPPEAKSPGDAPKKKKAAN
jgi:hypothetical protein